MTFIKAMEDADYMHIYDTNNKKNKGQVILQLPNIPTKQRMLAFHDSFF